jgi:hypothetical protein
MLQHLLSSCTNLTHIDLTNQLIDDYGLAVLLRYATNVTDVELGYFELAKSRANSTCRWQRLKLETTPSLLEGLAYLPLKSVQDLVTGWEVPGRDVAPASHPLITAAPPPVPGSLQPGSLPSMEEEASGQDSPVYTPLLPHSYHP